MKRRLRRLIRLRFTALKISHVLGEGERVLIHSATGAVGLSAIQVARSLGAEIHATAGSASKRAYLQELGIKYIYDSRSLHFVDSILRDTNGYGVDVVLNSVAGEVLQQSFQLLAPYGRFIEIGKRDITENNALPLGVFNRNILFASIDMDRIMKDRPQIVHGLLRRIEKGFADGRFQPMPTEVFSANNAAAAFDKMRRSEHMGKLVVSFEDELVELARGGRGVCECGNLCDYRRHSGPWFGAGSTSGRTGNQTFGIGQP